MKFSIPGHCIGHFTSKCAVSPVYFFFPCALPFLSLLFSYCTYSRLLNCLCSLPRVPFCSVLAICVRPSTTAANNQCSAYLLYCLCPHLPNRQEPFEAELCMNQHVNKVNGSTGQKVQCWTFWPVAPTCHVNFFVLTFTTKKGTGWGRGLCTYIALILPSSIRSCIIWPHCVYLHKIVFVSSSCSRHRRWPRQRCMPWTPIVW